METLISLPLFRAMRATPSRVWGSTSGVTTRTRPPVGLLAWSAVILSALTAAGLQNVFGPHPKPDPLDIAIPEVIWGLLGLGSFTLVAAAQIAGGNRSQQPLEVVPQSDGTTRIENGIVVNLRPKDANWSDLVTGEGTQAGQVEIAKLQKLAITLLLVCVYFSDLYRMFGSEVPIESLPAVSAGMVALIGISDATFLANKQFSAFRYRETAGAHRSIDAQDHR